MNSGVSSRGRYIVDGRAITNSGGIVLTMAGVYMVYANSPINSSVIDGGNFDTDFAAIDRDTRHRNLLMRVGVYVVLIGSFLQLVSNFLPAANPSAA
nr:putative integron gene cassette protein [uncultured bacterium]